MAASSGMPSDIPDVINVGLMGLGVVGTGVAAHLLARWSTLADVSIIYTSDASDEEDRVELRCRRII